MAALFAPSFLRPLPAPHPRFVRSILRQASSSATAAAASRAEPINPSNPPPSPAAAPAYHVHRTPSQQLPVYHMAKRGGNLHQTRIRKIEGDAEALRADLQKALALEDRQILLNPLTKHIVIKGWKKREVAAFLEQQRF